MERHGFIRDMLDVKVLILYVMARVKAPTDAETIYALCFQDDSLSYFDVKEALPQLVDSGHLELYNGHYVITQKGREQGAVTADAIPYPVLQRAADAVQQHNKTLQQHGWTTAEVVSHGADDFAAVMTISDGHSDLMRLELAAPSQRQAELLAEAFRQNANQIYSNISHTVLDLLEPDPHASL